MVTATTTTTTTTTAAVAAAAREGGPRPDQPTEHPNECVCSGYTSCTGVTESLPCNKAIVCEGVSSCADSLWPADAGCSNDFSCTSGSRARVMELASHSGKCTGAGACKGASISSELEPSFAGPSQLHCSAAGACSNAKISLPLLALSCSGTSACAEAQVEARAADEGKLAVTCGPSASACSNMTLSSFERRKTGMLQCSGARTCADLSWTTRVVGGMLFNCTGSDACARSAFINNGSAILRCGQGSCEGLTLDVTCGCT